MYGIATFRVLLYHTSVLIRNSYRDIEAPLKWPPGTPDGTPKLALTLSPKFMEHEMTKLAADDEFEEFKEEVADENGVAHSSLRSFCFRCIPRRDPNFYSKNDSQLKAIVVDHLYVIAQCFAAQTDKVNAPVVLVLIPVTASLDAASVVTRYFADPSPQCVQWLQEQLRLENIS